MYINLYVWQELVDEGQEILSRKDRKLRNKLFRAIQDGDIDFDEYEEMMGRPASMCLA